MEKKENAPIQENGGGGKTEQNNGVSKEVKKIIKSGGIPIVLGLERHVKQDVYEDDSDESETTESTESESSESESTETTESAESTSSSSSSDGIELGDMNIGGKVEKDAEEKEKEDEEEVLGYATINVNSWFKHIVGKDEKELRETIDKECPFECKCIQEDHPVPRRYNSVKIRNLSDPSKVFDAGLLYSTTVGKLKNVVTVGNEQKKMKGKLNVFRPPLTFEYADDQVNNIFFSRIPSFLIFNFL